MTSLILPLKTVPQVASDSHEDSAEQQAMKGQAKGWNALVREHNRRVVLTLIARGLRPDTARDLAQEAWTRLIEQQQLGRLSEIKMPGLAIKQALFLARDLIRRDKVEQQLAGAEAEALNPEPQLWARERLSLARQTLATCSVSEQQVFRATYGGSCRGAQDVAQQTGLSVQRVRQIICELRKKLRTSLKESCDDDS